MNDKLYCEVCRKKTAPLIQEDVAISVELKGTECKCVGKKAVCQECGSELWAPEIEEYNKQQVYSAFREINDIISIEEIRSIPKKLNIGKRHLSLLLGWGEITFTRYYDGYIPTPEYSKTLKEIISSPEYYRSLLLNALEKEPDNKAYKRSLEKLESNEPDSSNKIFKVSDYLIKNGNDVTQLSLQKLLYWTQGFYKALYGAEIFLNECQAWAYGPVYSEVRQKYVSYGKEPLQIKSLIEVEDFSEEEIDIMDNILRNFGILQGAVLIEFTHNECPWIETRENLPKNAPCKKVIDMSLLDNYFSKIVCLYNIKKPQDICNYFNALLSLFRKNQLTPDNILTPTEQ